MGIVILSILTILFALIARHIVKATRQGTSKQRTSEEIEQQYAGEKRWILV